MGAGNRWVNSIGPCPLSNRGKCRDKTNDMKHMIAIGVVLGLSGNIKAEWVYRIDGENPPQTLNNQPMKIEKGPITWKISQTIRLRDPQGKIEAEARGLECKINNVATTSIVVNCNNANEQQEMKTKYEGKTYKFMLGCVSTGQ